MEYLAPEWPFIVLSIPIIWFLILLTYHIFKLIGLWLKYKLQTLKEIIK
tara:strand:- start:167 stop:313 length:147 start_codon:yes stop_codon:yes gene_type:complete